MENTKIGNDSSNVLEILIGVPQFVLRWTLGSDYLTVFKGFRFIFSLKKQTIEFSLFFNLYFQQKRTPKL